MLGGNWWHRRRGDARRGFSGLWRPPRQPGSGLAQDAARESAATAYTTWAPTLIAPEILGRARGQRRICGARAWSCTFSCAASRPCRRLGTWAVDIHAHPRRRLQPPRCTGTWVSRMPLARPGRLLTVDPRRESRWRAPVPPLDHGALHPGRADNPLRCPLVMFLGKFCIKKAAPVSMRKMRAGGSASIPAPVSLAPSRPPRACASDGRCLRACPRLVDVGAHFAPLPREAARRPESARRGRSQAGLLGSARCWWKCCGGAAEGWAVPRAFLRFLPLRREEGTARKKSGEG
jgi:hypothetical protein